jgi:hypothetical protein
MKLKTNEELINVCCIQVLTAVTMNSTIFWVVVRKELDVSE